MVGTPYGRSAVKEAVEAAQAAAAAKKPERVWNFNPGPAVLPLPVLEEAQRDLVALPGVGMSVLEISHRSKTFEGILAEAEADLRAVLGIPANYKVIFLGGGASLQFAMVAMNLLPKDGSADYIDTGSWATAAIKEAKKIGKVNVAATTQSDNYSRLPRPEEIKLNPNAAYVHFTSNNTIEGTEWFTEPAAGAVPLVCDASSDILSRPIEVSKYGLIYAGAQKNMGPAGVTVVIIREDLLGRVPAGLPAMLDYKLQAEKGSLYNTPPVFAIYMVRLVLKWLKGIGGLDEMERRNREKADLLYAAIDSSDGFYRGTAEKASRSRMNVTYRLPSEELEKKFVEEAKAAKLVGLAGHRSVGGIRASLYNALPKEAVEALVAFMQDFKQRNSTAYGT
ncbi:MAG TPA: 3-phosphoserine/phosphohydroxythreonine transaminase [Candidatus Xenobia bacterium]|nr:3-phosphoserine/phosphohydroxythreonine transaminase [Candidatus Xenobia bacterium]